MITEKQIVQRVEDLLKGSDLFLVETVVKPGNKIIVFLDGDNGVTIAACQKISHALELTFDRNIDDFELTVSSAGIDRPLKLPRQFQKNLGKLVTLTTFEGASMTGKVVHINEEGIELELLPEKKKKLTGQTLITLSFKNIQTAKEVITFKK
jgi:ribosome maturation factor RimP